jgi:hypothetical protein
LRFIVFNKLLMLVDMMMLMQETTSLLVVLKTITILTNTNSGLLGMRMMSQLIATRLVLTMLMVFSLLTALIVITSHKCPTSASSGR